MFCSYSCVQIRFVRAQALFALNEEHLPLLALLNSYLNFSAKKVSENVKWMQVANMFS